MAYRIDTNLTTEVTSMLINVNLHESNRVNIVIPETQMAQMTEGERELMLRLYDKIEKKTCVIDIDRISLHEKLQIEWVSDTFLQLFFYTVISSLNDMVQKITLKEVDFSGNCFYIFFTLLSRYVRYGRCNHLMSMTITRIFKVWLWSVGCRLCDAQIPTLCDMLHLFSEKNLKEFSFLNLDGKNEVDIWIEDNALSATGLKTLICTIMECRRNNMSIDFSIIHNPLGNSGIEELLTNYYLHNSESLDTLNLNGCSMTDLGVEKLLQVFQSLDGKNTIYALNLSGIIIDLSP